MSTTVPPFVYAGEYRGEKGDKGDRGEDGARGGIGPAGAPGPGGWAPSHAYTIGDVVQAQDGSRISRIASGTSRPTFDTTEQAAWAVVVTETGTLERVAIDARYNHGQAATQVVMRKLAHGEDARVAILSDSTDDASNEWGKLLAVELAADWPTQTVTWTPPSNDAYVPGTTITVHAGTAGTLAIYNMAISGSQSYNWQSADFLAQLTTFDPHLVLIASGHNDGGFTGDPQNLGKPRHAFRLRNQLMVEELSRLFSSTEFVLIAQHPWSDAPNGDMDQKRDEWRLIARRGGHGFFDMYQAWTDVGSATTAGWYLDNKHINATGEQFYADTLHGLFVYDAKWEPRPARASLLDQATPLNLADDMVMPLTATGPIGWTLQNVTVTRDTTNVESARGYAINVVPVDDTQKSRIYKQILTSTTVLPWRGKWVTVLARMRRPAAGGVDNRYVGQVSTSDGTNTCSTFNDDTGYGGFMWRAVPHFVNAAATGLTVSLWSDNGPTPVGTYPLHNPTVTWDRFMVIPGLTPYGWAGRAGAGAIRNAETFEGVDVGATTVTTQSRIALIAAASIQRLLAVYSGVNRIWQITTSGTESGTNVGGDLAFQAYDDSGNLIGTNLYLNRRFGLLRFNSTTTAARPSASVAGSGAASAIVDSDLKSLLLSDGTVWVPQVGRSTGTVTSHAAPTILAGSADYYFTITALATAPNMSTNLTAAPILGQRLHIAITDNGTARAITWGSSYEASTVALPTTTVVSTRLDVQFVWNAATSKWRCVGVA